MVVPVPLPSHVPGGVRHFLALVLLCGLGLSNGPVQGQSTTDTLQEAEWSSRIREAVTAYQRQNHTRALNQLLPLFEANPLVRSKNGEGTAAYWLGRVYEDQSRPMMARRVWSVGVQKSVEEGGLDVRSADAYIRAVYRDSVKAEYTQAANVYLLLFEKGDEKPPPGAREVIRRHVAQMEFLLPDTLRRAILQGKDQNREVDTTVRSRHRLASWWRSQDPKPATAKNERLVEHLQRVNHARVHYDYEKALSGFDDRGRVYVRLGAPTVTTTIDFDSGELLDVIHRIQESAGNNLFVSVSSFPENKFWLYKHGDEPSPFLFVHNGNTYRIGEIIDLIPERYTSAMTGRTGRGGAKVDFVLEALRTAYRQLSMYHTAYGPEFNRLDQYLNKMEETRIRFEGQSGSMLYTRGNRSDNSALTQQEGSPQPLGKSPSEMARSAFVTANQQEVKIARQRKKHTPRQETNTLDDVARLPVATRIARFLEQDGTTSTRVYWGISARDLDGEKSSASGPRLVNLSVRQMTSDYRTRHFETKKYLVEPLTGSDDITVADEQVQLEGDTSMYHLGLQWDQYSVRTSGGGGMKAGRRLRSGTAKVDSLQPLVASARQLEMSDIVPVLHHSGESHSAPTRELDHPYPFTQISENASLAFYFEVYHMRKGSADETRYTVRYKMYRRTDRGRLKQLFKDTEGRRTSVSRTRTGQRRTVKEYILLDLKDWGVEADTKLTVTIQVTDERSDQQVERSAKFRVVPTGGG